MTEPDDVDEDLFADLYQGDDIPTKFVGTISQSPTAPIPTASLDNQTPSSPKVVQNTHGLKASETLVVVEQQFHTEAGLSQSRDEDVHMNGNSYHPKHITTEQGFTGTVGIKEDGKMFIGGLNWETTDQSLRDYFSQFGEVLECTVMRDGASGRSRGFGFLTFKDPKTVNTVMVKEHYLDGKIIDPKRAIPRDEQEKTSKIFVGGVSQEATERDFESFFAQFGRVIDATLMMDKDTGRPRGFGFVTFEGEAAVEATLAQPLEILGKPIEVKRAQPRGNIKDEEEGRVGKFGRRGQNDRYGRGAAQDNQINTNDPPHGQQGGTAGNNMTPQMMAQYWQQLQQYFAMMQQRMAAAQGQSMGSGMGMGMGMNMGMAGANPAMIQQMMAMQGLNRAPDGSQGSQAAASQGNMSPVMMQQLAQMQQVQQIGQGMLRMDSPTGTAANANRPAYTAQEQLAFEQRKYEQQQAHRTGSQGLHNGGTNNSSNNNNNNNNNGSGGSNYAHVGSPGGSGITAGRESSFDEASQSGQNRGFRTNRNQTPQSNNGPHQIPSQAPANAPTGPKNAGKPGSNYRGGGRGSHRAFHPYSRNA